MNDRIQGQAATRAQPLRAEPRLAAPTAQMPPTAPRSPIPPIGGPAAAASARAGGHIAGLEASGPGLLRSMLKAGGVAAVILAVFYLPAEYGVDPTGIGGLLGLTEMGAIKQQLYAEGVAQDAAAASAVGAANPEVLARLDRIEAQVDAMAALFGLAAAARAAEAAPQAAPAAPVAEPVPVAEPEPAPVVAAAPVSEVAPQATAADPGAWRDEVTATLAPSEAIEIKLAMEEGETATFAWSANGGALNYTTHGDGGGEITYEDGRAVPEQTGELTAAFTGRHGWFWRNRTDAPVTLTLRTGGEYDAMLR